MKKITLFMMTLVLTTALQSWAGPVNESTARSIALGFLKNNRSLSLQAANSSDLRLLHVEMGDAKINQPVFYIYNTSTTFLVIAGDDRAEEILMVGDRPLKNINDVAPAFKDILAQYKDEIGYLQEHPGLVVEKRIPRNTSLQATVTGPLLTALWDQQAPFWDLCQFTYNGTSYQCYTGCPATSAAMLLYYWKHPTQVDAIDAYTAEFHISTYNSVNYTYPALPAIAFDWDNMKDAYDTYTPEQGNAVATLMRYVGQAEQMMYGTVAAGGSGIYVSDNYKIVDLLVRWGYDATTCRLIEKANYFDSTWAKLIQKEITEERPVLYAAINGDVGGHAFNVDGYDSSTNKYHVNFGWSGEGNSWYAMNAFSYEGYNFNKQQRAIIGIQPAQIPVVTPQLSVNPTLLSFTNCTLGETYTKTFTVTGSDLTGDLMVTLNDANGIYSVDKTSITASEAANGAIVTVTYSPTTSEASEASVTIRGGGVEAQTVTLHGLTLEPNVIYTDANEVVFDPTYTGYQVSRTITITAIVSENIQLNWVRNLSGSFGISKTTITPQEAAAGAKVTICFGPTWHSSTIARLQIKSQGAESVIIPVSGTKIHSDGYITAWPTNLSFETQVGTPVTKTFRLHYSVSNGNDAIMISETGGDDETTSDNGNNGGGTLMKIPAGSLGPATTENKKLIIDSTTIKPIFPPISPVQFNNLYLAVTGDDCFTVTPDQISITEANGGYDVTVTYNPQWAGTHDATITITATGVVAKPLTIKLHGTATGSDITTMHGDVNQNGTVNLNDATDLISILLTGSDAPACADVNGDHEVSIGDVTELIKLLTK